MSFWADVLATQSPAVVWKEGEASAAGGAIDATGNGRTGTYVAMEAGDFGQPSILPNHPSDTSVLYGGNGEFIELAHAAWMNAGNNITAMRVLRLTDLAAQRDVMGKLNRWQLWIETTGKLTLYVTPAWTSVTMDASLSLVAGTSYIVFVRKNATTGLISIWVNGVKRAELAHGGSLTNSVDPLRASGSSTDTTRSVKALGQGFAYWPHVALSDAEIVALSASYALAELPPPVPTITSPVPWPASGVYAATPKRYAQYVPVRYSQVVDPNGEAVQYQAYLSDGVTAHLIHDWQAYDPETIVDVWTLLGMSAGQVLDDCQVLVRARDTGGLTSAYATSSFFTVEGPSADPEPPTLTVVHRRDNQIVFKTDPTFDVLEWPQWRLREPGGVWVEDYAYKPLQENFTNLDAYRDLFDGLTELGREFVFWTGPLEPDTDYEVQARRGQGEWGPVLEVATLPRMGSAFRNLVIERGPFVYYKFRSEEWIGGNLRYRDGNSGTLLEGYSERYLQDESGWHSGGHNGGSTGLYGDRFSFSASTMVNEPGGEVLDWNPLPVLSEHLAGVDNPFLIHTNGRTRVATLSSFHFGMRVRFGLAFQDRHLPIVYGPRWKWATLANVDDTQFQQLTLYDTDGTTVLAQVTTDVDTNDDQWHLCEAGYDAATGKLYVRMDGSELETATYMGWVPGTGSTILSLAFGDVDEFWGTDALPTLADHQDLNDAQGEAPTEVPAPGAFTDPDADVVYFEVVPIAHGPSVVPDDLPEYRYEYSFGGGGWLLLRDWGEPLLTEWLLDNPTPALDYKLRVRSRGIGSENLSDWVESPSFAIRLNFVPAPPVFVTPPTLPRATYERFVPIVLEVPTDPDEDPVEVQLAFVDEDDVETVFYPWGPWLPAWQYDAGILPGNTTGRIVATYVDTLGGVSESYSGYFYLHPERPDFPYEYKNDFEDLNALAEGVSLDLRPDAISFDHHTVFSPGPSELGNTEHGLLDRAWKLRYDGLGLWLAKANDANDGWEAETFLSNFSNIRELDFCFAQNGDPVLAAEVNGILWIRWFDPVISATIWEEFGPGRTPKLILDDPNDTTNSDVTVFYIDDAADAVRMRVQRERYDIANPVPITGVANLYLEEAVRGKDLRVHLIYSQRDPISGRYLLGTLSSFPSTLGMSAEAVQVSTRFVAGELVVAIIEAFTEPDSVSWLGRFLGGELTDIMLEGYATEEDLEFGGRFTAGDFTLVVIEHEIFDAEELDWGGRFASGWFEQVLFALTGEIEGIDFGGRLVGVTLEVV